jgi:hypothetical protein
VLTVEAAASATSRYPSEGASGRLSVRRGALVIERHKGKLIPGAYYVFRFRGYCCVGSVPAEVVRRYLHTTPTGRWAVEMFNDAEGNAHRSYKDPKYWQPYYRIVRHCG